QHLVHVLAAGRERQIRRQPATVLLHRLGVTLSFDAQQRVGRIGSVGAAHAFPVTAFEADLADGAHESAFFGAAVFFLASTGADADRRPFFSAISIRRVTASPSTCPWNFRPFSITASSQASKTCP